MLGDDEVVERLRTHRPQPFRLGVTDQDLDEREPMLARDEFVQLDHTPVPFRVVDEATGEPVEPGSSGTVVIPHDGWYRIESAPEGPPA